MNKCREICRAAVNVNGCTCHAIQATKVVIKITRPKCGNTYDIHI